MDEWAGVVLAAGLGTRMKSSVPKVLHKVCGQEMVLYPVRALREAGVRRVTVVVSPQAKEGVGALLGDSVEYVVQQQPLGTGHALLQCAASLRGAASQVMVLGGDSPLVTSSTLKAQQQLHSQKGACVTLATSNRCLQPEMGRVLRSSDGEVVGIMEASEWKDGPPGEEVNAGVYCFQGSWLWDSLERIPVGGKGEFYLTALVAMEGGAEGRVEALVMEDSEEALGVNDRVELAAVERAMCQRVRHRWMLEGVTMLDPTSVFIDAAVSLGQDTVIYPNTMVLGETRVGERCTIGPGSVVRDSHIGNGCRITASFVEEATLEDDVDVGPFSHLRPGAYLERGVHIGNFSEVKNSRLGQGVAMGHFGYVGDASIGAGVNLGAGTVTCNFDGVNHQRTEVEEGAFIGSDTMLVAPIRVGAYSITGAGSVVTKDVPSHRLAVGVPAKIKKRKRKPSKKRDQ